MFSICISVKKCHSIIPAQMEREQNPVIPVKFFRWLPPELRRWEVMI